MKREELIYLMQKFEKLFSLVRLVDLPTFTEYRVTEEGELVASPHQCFISENRVRHCENCILAQAIACKGSRAKFEFADQVIYYAIARYVEVEGKTYALELVTTVNDEALVGAFAKEQFVDTITDYNKKLYLDSLTGIYNRRYYDEQLSLLAGRAGLAMMDVDDFKHVNDHYGHLFGDRALQAIAAAIQGCVRETDAVVRYGGDEFLVYLQAIPKRALSGKLAQIRRAVSAIRFEEHPELRLSISVGAVYCKEFPARQLARADQLLYQAKAQKTGMEIDR